MKIKRVERVKFEDRLLDYAEDSSGGKFPFYEAVEVGRERYAMFDGIIVQDLAQIQELIQSQAPPNSMLLLRPTESAMMGQLWEGKAFSVPKLLTYAEALTSSDDGDEPPDLPFAYTWEVELEIDATARKEQVSLTLSAATLAQLRLHASATKQSLSAVIDSRLRFALGMQASEYEDNYQQLMSRLEELLREAKGKAKLSSSRDANKQAS